MTKYRFNGEIYGSRDEMEKAVSFFAEDTYDDFLDECYEEITIGSMTYPCSLVLERVDEIAYRCGLSDYEDFLLGDVEEIEEEGEE